MPADLKWVKENFGTAARLAGAPEERAASAPTRDRDFVRGLIEFDSEGPELTAFAAHAPNASVGLTKYVDINWPRGLAPEPGAKPRGESLPKASVLIVTWTMDEGHALSRVLTPGKDSNTDWKPYTKNYAAISKHMVAGCPAREKQRLGTFWTTKIGTHTVTLFKSDSHLSQDGPDLPNATVWKQIIADCDPAWVITTGTGGGIGTREEVGDCIVSRFVSFDCRHEFKRLNGQQYASPTNAPRDKFEEAATLFRFNAQFLPATNKRKPKIDVSTSYPTGIATTDFFGFDNSARTYGLEGHGALSEMGDAVLGMVGRELGKNAPNYAIVRNVSDPQIASAGMTLAQQKTLAGDIYKAYGRWSSVCSAIVCWSIVAAL